MSNSHLIVNWYTFIPGRPSRHSKLENKLQSLPAHKAKIINNTSEWYYFKWRMHFRTFIFMAHIWNVKKKKRKKSQYMNHTSSRKRGRGKKIKKITSLRLTLWCCLNKPTWSTMTPSHLCLSRNPTPVPLKRGSQCFNDSHGVSTHTMHEQSVHKCNITVQRLHHIPCKLYHDSNGPFGNPSWVQTCDYFTLN